MRLINIYRQPKGTWAKKKKSLSFWCARITISGVHQKVKDFYLLSRGHIHFSHAHKKVCCANDNRVIITYKYLDNSVGIGGCTQNARRMDYMSGKRMFV